MEKNKRSDIELKRLSDKIAELTEINKKTDAAKPPLDNYSHSVGNSNCTEQPLATSKIEDVTLLQSNPLESQSMTSGRAPNVTASRITSAATVGASYGRLIEQNERLKAENSELRIQRDLKSFLGDLENMFGR